MVSTPSSTTGARLAAGAVHVFTATGAVLALLVVGFLIGGNVIVANTSGTQVGLPGTEFEGILDSTEIVSNVIGGNLICHRNTPPAQIGDAILDEGNGANTVGGNALGECAALSD